MTDVDTPIRAEAAGAHELRASVERALALLDAGDVEHAREELREVIAPATGLAPAPPEADPLQPVPAFEQVLADDEIDDAFDSAETNADEMMNANKVVEETLEAPDLAGPEPVSPPAPDAPFDITRHPTYATRTMAELLEGQGRRAEASALRAALPADAEAAALMAAAAPQEELEPEYAAGAAEAAEAGFLGAADAERLRIIATLESWLHNVRRGMSRDASRSGGNDLGAGGMS